MVSTYPPHVRQIVIHGVAAGIIVGMVMAVTEMLIDFSFGKGFWMPLRMIGSMVLGEQALDSGYALWRAAATGFVLHASLSALYGMIFLGGLALVRQLGAHAMLLVLYGALFGMALWLVNFEGIARVFWPQFGMASGFWNGFFAHTFAFGVPLGVYAAEIRPAKKTVGRTEREAVETRIRTS